MHKGTYADDCLCERVKQHKCYIVATCDRDLRRRIRKVWSVDYMASVVSRRWLGLCLSLTLIWAVISSLTLPTSLYCTTPVTLTIYPPALPQIPGVPIMFIQSHRYSIERLPDATVGGAPRT